jgi:hypothetical protein
MAGGSIAKRNKTASFSRVRKLSSAREKIRACGTIIRVADKLNIFDDPKAFSEVSRLISTESAAKPSQSIFQTSSFLTHPFHF